tara:strand:+ start:393 stop:1154 length:762 start_codon:yes stop_codon:yes gene_type:complete
MSNFSDFIGSSGGGAALETVILTKSQTWTPPVNGTGIIHVIGAGASGSADANFKAGGAGGYSRKAVTFATGTNWTIVVGAGGLPTAVNVGVIAGGNSTAADGSTSMLAYGGSVSSGLGGSASGGDVNFTGGKGGGVVEGGGGGAVGVFANGSTALSYSGGHTTDANGGADSFLVLGLGQLIGGSGGGSGGGHGGFLSGGGNNVYSQAGAHITGGKGGIGGGGGMAYNTSGGSGTRTGGAGGDGLVVIQYLTVS